MAPNQPWKPAIATGELRAIASNEKLKITYTKHARDQMIDRDLVVSDVLYVLKYGFVLIDPQTSSQPNLYKYRIETRSPNSGNRSVGVVVIPDASAIWLKIVTVMWID